MKEIERKLYLKYRKYDAIIMPQVMSIKTFYTSKHNSFFTFLLFFKCTPGLHKKNLSNQLSNSSINFGLRIKQTEFYTKS